MTTTRYRTAALLAGLLLALAAACGTEAGERNSRTPDPVLTAPPAEPADADLVADLPPMLDAARDADPTLWQLDDELIYEIVATFCNAFDDGMTPAQVVAIGTVNGVPGGQVGTLMGVAGLYECPEHLPMLQAYADSGL